MRLKCLWPEASVAVVLVVVFELVDLDLRQGSSWEGCDHGRGQHHAGAATRGCADLPFLVWRRGSAFGGGDGVKTYRQVPIVVQGFSAWPYASELIRYDAHPAAACKPSTREE